MLFTHHPPHIISSSSVSFVRCSAVLARRERITAATWPPAPLTFQGMQAHTVTMTTQVFAMRCAIYEMKNRFAQLSIKFHRISVQTLCFICRPAHCINTECVWAITKTFVALGYWVLEFINRAVTNFVEWRQFWLAFVMFEGVAWIELQCRR